MATNFEFYKDEIMEIVEQKKGIAVVNNRPIICDKTLCNICELKCAFCEWRFIQWLLKEHVEAPKLTKRERAFCEAVQTGWISINNRAVWSDVEPICSEAECGKYFIYPGYHEVFKIPYSLFDVGRFERWTKHKAEDLLKLEVIEEAQE